MSELDKVVAALVATEVSKQLGERNSLPYVKRSNVTAAQWRALVVIEAWDLLSASHNNAVAINFRLMKGEYVHINRDILGDAAFNVGAPAKFGKMDLNLYGYPEHFEYVISGNSVLVRKR